MNRAAAKFATAAAGTRSASSFAGAVYKNVFKRNPIYISYIIVGAIVVENVYVGATDALWNSWNAGVSCLRACLRAY